MEITLLEVKLDKALPAAGSRTMGYLGQFKAGALTGWAVLVPHSGDKARLVKGAKLSVESMFDRTEDWKLDVGGTGSQLVPLDNPGDYRVTSTLVVIGQNTAALIEAQGFAFDLTRDELPKPRPSDGTRVSFTLRGLSLWDEGL